MWSSSTQRRTIIIIIIIILIKIVFFRVEKKIVIRDLSETNLFEYIADQNLLWLDEGEEKSFEGYSKIPAFEQVSKKLAAIGNDRTAICETDTLIGQQVLCGLQEKFNDESVCDSDSLTYFADIDDLKRENELNANFTNWKLLFPRQDPIERFVDHFMDACVREDRSCFNCKLDLRCYLIQIWTQLTQIHSKTKKVDEDHMKYVPQNWFCEMEEMNQKFTFVDYSLFAKPTNPAYAEMLRPDRIDNDGLLADSLSSYEKISSFYKSFIYSRADVLDLFTKVYYYDYMVLQIPLPQLKDAEVRDYREGWH